LIVLGGFLATCTVGPAAGIVIGAVHPGVRSTGTAVLSLFQNLFGLAAGPFIAGLLSDAVGLEAALTLTPIGSFAAALSFLAARRTVGVMLREDECARFSKNQKTAGSLS
jgi:hypothetical protein